MSERQITVLVVDDNADLASMLVRLIGGEPDMACVGELPCADSLIEMVELRKPNIVLIDLTMPGRDPLEVMFESTSSQLIVPSNCLVRWAVTSVNRNSYGPVLIGVPTGVSISASVRRLKPPNPQIVTTSNTRARTTAP